MATSSFELEKILDYKKNARNKWYVLCRWRGFGPEEDKWEPASSFIHGYTDTFIKFLKKHPEFDRELSLIKDCVTKEDLQAQEEAPSLAQPIRELESPSESAEIWQIPRTKHWMLIHSGITMSQLPLVARTGFNMKPWRPYLQ